MTLQTSDSPPPPSAPVSPTVRARWRRWRGPLGFLAALALLALFIGTRAAPVPTGDLDPEGADPAGSRAAVEIAERLGAEVTIARSVEAAEEAAGGDTLLVTVQSHRLAESAVERVAELPGEHLLIRPTTRLLTARAPGVEVSGRAETETLPAECALPAAETAGEASMGGELYAAEGEAVGCYPADGGHGLVRVPGDTGGTTVLGTGEPLRNSNLDRAGNAALVLNLLTDRPNVVWLIPEVAPSERTTLGELLPVGLYAAAAQLGVALLALVLWRGRRMGPLVTERLPVVVRASETTEGRAGLYRSRRARDRAVAGLRAGFLDRVTPLLGLGTDPGPDAVTEAVAMRSGRDPRTVRALLYGAESAEGDDSSTATDAALVRFADELDTLEKEVRES